MSRTRNVVVGLFLVGGILLFGVGLFLIGSRRQLFEDHFFVHAEFAKLGGLANGAPVRVAGMDAGEVVEISVPSGPAAKFRVRARVIETLHPLARNDSVATIQTDGIVGNKYLQIDPGTEHSPAVQANGTIQSREPFEFSDLMTELRQTVTIANTTITDVRGDVENALKVITETVGETQELIQTTGDDVKRMAKAGSQISEDLTVIVRDVREGRGTVGKLFRDEALYADIRGTADNVSKATANLRQISDEANRMMADVRSREVIAEVEQTVKNVRELTERVKTAVADLQSKGGGATITTDLRQTLEYARETMENMAENTTALKRNWFFRGFFKDRGFYDLDSLTLKDYRAGEFARGRQAKREWLPSSTLFAPGADGFEVLTDAGKKRIDTVMAAFLQHPKDSIFMIEGYASQGTAADQFLRSRERSEAVRDYLMRKYRLDPVYVGTMPMGAVEVEGGGRHWDGVALVLFHRSEPVR